MREQKSEVRDKIIETRVLDDANRCNGLHRCTGRIQEAVGCARVAAEQIMTPVRRTAASITNVSKDSTDTNENGNDYMAKARAIVKRLKAVRNIRKITRTMELIATARFKKAMDRATEAAAYTRKISEIVADLARADLTVRASAAAEARRRKDTRSLLVLTSNRGLCGGYNGGVLRLCA